MDMVFRALAIYLFLVIVFKVAGRRALLQMTSFDLILLLIISEATQQALLGEDFSVTGAMITITTLVVVDIIFGLLKKYFTAAQTSGPTVLHAVLKNKEVYPSGPGLLSLAIENMARLTSSFVRPLTSIICCSVPNRLGKNSFRLSTPYFNTLESRVPINLLK